MRGKEKVVEETNGNIDLNLSLSLNGRFGVDPQRNGTQEKDLGRGRNELQSLALMDANKRRPLDSSGSSTISYFQNQIIEGQGFSANIGCSADKNQGQYVEVVAENILPKAIPAKEVKGRVFDKVANMPIVFTTISGRKMKGLLFKCNKEERKIICVCHAYSMTPAEFIKHVGGGDVANPERHIKLTIKRVVGDGEVVNP